MQSFDFAKDREPVERQMGVFRQPHRKTKGRVTNGPAFFIPIFWLGLLFPNSDFPEKPIFLDFKSSLF